MGQWIPLADYTNDRARQSASTSQTLDSIMNNMRQSQQDQRQNRLSDLQYQALQQKMQDDATIRKGIAGIPQTVTQVTAPERQGMSLAQAFQPASPESGQMSGLASLTNQPNIPAQTAQVPNPSYGSDLAKLYMQNGRMQDAASATETQSKIISLDAMVNKQAAEAQMSGGDPQKAALAQAQLAHSKELFGIIGPLLKNKTPFSQHLAQQQIDAYKQAYPNNPLTNHLSVDDFKTDPNGDTVLMQKDPSGKNVGYYTTNPASGEMTYQKLPEQNRQLKEIPSPDGKTAQMYSIDPTTGDRLPVGAAYTVKSQVPSVNVRVNQSPNNQVDALARGIVDGTINPDSISKRGALQSAVFARVKEMNPNFNIVGAGAQAKFIQSTGTMQTKALLNTIDPLLEKLDAAGKGLGNSSIPGVNRIVNWTKEATGNPEIVGFNNLRDDSVAEIERGLMGTGVLSDSKYQRALKNVNSAQSYPQLQSAIKNIRTVISARLDSLAQGPNPNNSGSQTGSSAGGGNVQPSNAPTRYNGISSFWK